MNDTTKVETLDAARALQLLREVVAERPDYVYPPAVYEGTCQYTREGKPDCLIGHVLARAGVPIAEIEKLDTASRNGAPCPALGIAYRLQIDPAVARILQAAQSTQDKGRPWGEALAAAEVEFQGQDGAK